MTVTAQPAEHIAPQVIRPQHVLRQAWGCESVHGIGLNRVVGGEQGSKEGAEDGSRQHHE